LERKEIKQQGGEGGKKRETSEVIQKSKTKNGFLKRG